MAREEPRRGSQSRWLVQEWEPKEKVAAEMGQFVVAIYIEMSQFKNEVTELKKTPSHGFNCSRSGRVLLKASASSSKWSIVAQPVSSCGRHSAGYDKSVIRIHCTPNWSSSQVRCSAECRQCTFLISLLLQQVFRSTMQRALQSQFITTAIWSSNAPLFCVVGMKHSLKTTCAAPFLPKATCFCFWNLCGQNWERSSFPHAITSVILGDGKSILLWSDAWAREGTLMNRFPCLYSHCNKKDATVQQTITSNMRSMFVNRLSNQAQQELRQLSMITAETSVTD